MSKLKIVVTGSTGFIGETVVAHFKNHGHSVCRLLRPNSKTQKDPTDIVWNPVTQTILPQLEGIDVVIHLAGENLSGQYWTPKFKTKILESRVQGTGALCRILARLKKSPKILLSASAIGYYGYDHVDEPLIEGLSSGKDFLANVCGEWEQATRDAELAGVRVVHMRFGAVLGKEGGALGKMLLPFKLGLGGPLGSGKQKLSWISVKEIPLAMEHLISHPEIKGAVNFVAPQSVSNEEFTKTLGKVLNRPTVFPVPAFMLRLLFGEMADAILLSSANVVPEKLRETGYQFKYGELETALKEAF